MATYFGSSDHTLSQGFGGQNKFAQSASATVSGSITVAQAYCGGRSLGDINMKFIVYADSSGSPGSLLGASDAIVVGINSASTTHSFTFSTPITGIVAGTSYWIGLIYDQDFNIGYNTGGTLLVNSNVYASGPSNPFGTATSNAWTAAVQAGVTSPSGGGQDFAPLLSVITC